MLIVVLFVKNVVSITRKVGAMITVAWKTFLDVF